MTQIARKPRPHLASQGVLPKNRVWMTVYKAPGDFRPQFSPKKIHEQVAFGFRSPEAYGHWLEKGVCLDARSRLKGIETITRIFVFCNAGSLDARSRLKGIETKSVEQTKFLGMSVWMTVPA